MKLSRENAQIFVPDEAVSPFERVTHLGIGAHQDDLEILAYEAIEKCYSNKSKWFGGVTATNGAGSSRTGAYANYSDAEMAAERIREQNKAAYVGDYAFQAQLDFPSNILKDPSDQSCINDLVQIIEASKPEYVYMHNLADKHDTHIALATKCIAALRKSTHKPNKIYGVEVWRDLDWMNDEDKEILAADKRPNLAQTLIGLFDSQITGGKRYDLAIQGRRIANATFYASHESDDTEGMSYAMDLTPLINDESINIVDYTVSYIESFKNDVTNRINKFLE